jgi:hypothetical protein
MINLMTLGLFSQIEDGTDDTTPDGMQVFGVAFADSNYDGQGPTDITIAPGILYQFKGGALIEITSQSTANGGTFGAAWKQFAVDYNALTGRKVVLVNGARGGSTLYPVAGSPYDWYTTGGVLRAQFQANMTACLAFLGLSKPKAIFGNAVINDIRNGTSFANIQTAHDSAVSFVTTTYPGVPFLYSIPGHDGNGNINSLIQRQCRNMIVQKTRTVTDFYIDSNCMVFFPLGYGGLHFNTQDAYNHLGACKARWFANTVTGAGVPRNKHARAIISQHFGTLTTARKDLIEAEIIGLGSWIYDDLEYLYHMKVTDSKDQYIDYCQITCPQSVNTTFTANSHVFTDGTAGSNWQSSFVPSTLAIRGTTQTDQFHAIGIKTIYSDASTLRCAFGASNASGQFVAGHTTTGVFYRANDATLTLARPGGVMSNNTRVSVTRSGTTKAYWENGVSIHTATVSTTTNVPDNIIAGGRNNGGLNNNPMQEDFEDICGGRSTNVNQATLHSILNTRNTGW